MISPAAPSPELLRLIQGAIWAEHDALERAFSAATIAGEEELARVISGAIPDDLIVEFLRALDGDALVLACQVHHVPLACPSTGVEDELVRRALDTKASAVQCEDDTQNRARMRTAPSSACGACPFAPCRLRAAIPVVWRGRCLGVLWLTRDSSRMAQAAPVTAFAADLAVSLQPHQRMRSLRPRRQDEPATGETAERALRRSRDLLELTRLVTHGGTFEVDLTTGSVTMDNEVAFPLFEDRPAQGVSRGYWRSRIHPDDLAAWNAVHERTFLSPSVPEIIEYRYCTRDGAWRNARQAQTVVPATNGIGASLIGFVTDTTDEVEARRQLHGERERLEGIIEDRTAELSSANADLLRAARLKDEFLASMSHELRTPLNAILGLTEATRDGTWGAVTEGQDVHLQLVEESGHHLLSLITDILDLAKINAGMVDPVIDIVDVIATAEASLRLVRQAARTKQLRLEQQLPDAGLLLETDGRMLKQVLVNLLGNAVKFTPAGGRVLLEVDSDSDQLRFRVHDTGMGISRDAMRRIFRPFVQVQQGLARSYGGTGLGLALVARIADLLHGAVVVESEVGQGSVFTFTLPRHADAAWHPRTAVPSVEAGRRLSSGFHTILLAEDHGPSARTYADYLEANGYRVIVATDGEAAVRLAEDVRPALLVTDLQMPRMDGYAVIRSLRENPAFQQTPIVALSAHATSQDRDCCFAAGANAFLSKPASLRELRTTIAGFIGAPADGDQS